ncbi:hypothetical protein DXU07_36470 [Bradyrhizobium elkanii]|nr:hypothetical protein BLN97_19275 [Bradyrhizobium elkanii]
MPLYGNTTQGVVRKISYRTVKESVDSRATGPRPLHAHELQQAEAPGGAAWDCGARATTLDGYSIPSMLRYQQRYNRGSAAEWMR